MQHIKNVKFAQKVSVKKNSLLKGLSKKSSMTQTENGVALVSGFSPVIFKMVVENKTPEEVMFDTINSERYAPIKI